MTTQQKLPETIDTLIANGYSYDKTLYEAVKTVGEILDADRCFIYIRQPDQARGRIAFCWRKDGNIPDVVEPDWHTDTTPGTQPDPLIEAPLDMTESVYIDDLQTAGPGVLNSVFDHKTFGHRALIYAPIRKDGQLWGILEPCVFEQTRQWTDSEKAEIEAILPKLQPIIAEFVAL